MTEGGQHHNGAGPAAPAIGPLAVEAALLLDVVADRLAALKPGGPGSASPGPASGTSPDPATDSSAGSARPPAGGTASAASGQPLGPDGRCPECGSVPGASCTACPLCRFLAMLRGERPETTAKLVDGALLIVRALRSMIPEAPDSAASPTAGGPAAPGDPPPPPPPGRRGGFERIDIL